MKARAAPKRHHLTVSHAAFSAFKSLREHQKTHNSLLLLSLVKSARSHPIVLEDSNPQRFFLGSGVPELEDLTLTDRQLIEMAAKESAISPEKLIRAGVVFYAKREILSKKRHEEPSRAATQDQAEETLRPGVAGSADARMQKAYEELAMNNPPSPSKVAKRSATAFSTAVRWLQRNHPEHLVPTPESRRSRPFPRSPAKRPTPLQESAESSGKVSTHLQPSSALDREAVVLLGQVDRRLAEGSHDLDKRLAKRRAAGRIPGDTS